jgi:hypothetical protein
MPRTETPELVAAGGLADPDMQAPESTNQEIMSYKPFTGDRGHPVRILLTA